MRLALLFWCFLGALTPSRADGDSHSEWQALLRQVRELQDQGRYQQARDIAEAALAAAESLGARETWVAVTLIDYGKILERLGSYRDCEQAYRRAIRLLESYPNEQLLLCSALDNLAGLYMAYGPRYAEAERLRRRALALTIEVRGPLHPDVAVLLGNLANVRLARGDTAEARKLLQDALAFYEGPLEGDQRLRKALLSNSIAAACYREEQFELSLSYFLEGIKMMEEALGASHPDLAVPLTNAGSVYLKLHQLRAADQMLQRTVDIVTKQFGTGHPLLIEALTALAAVRRKEGDKKDAHRLLTQAEEISAQQTDRVFSKSLVSVGDLLDERQSRQGRKRNQ